MNCKEIHCVKNIKKGLYYCGVIFAIYKLVQFGNRVMGIMFELKTEGMGGKRGIMWSLMIYSACEIVGYQRAVK